MKKVLALVGLAAALSVAAAPAASAAGSVCYSAKVVVNGSSAVDQAGCVPLG